MSRLNLIYDFEDIEEHKRRVVRAKERQKVHDCLVRYTGNLLEKNEEMKIGEREILIKPDIIDRVLKLASSSMIQKGIREN